ncbi:MAG: peptide-binding protein [Sulfurimonas sp.]|nr:peptide-binding protein [Sulfurimonadaceae bacterium]
MKFLIFLFFSINIFASTLHLVTSSNPSRLNPILATDSASSEISSFLFNGLIKYDKTSTKIVGDLAESFYFEDDKTLIFKLRSGVKWHDGVSFSADDVIFTYEVLLSPTISTPYSSSFKHIKRIEKLDELTLKVIYKEPYFRALEMWGLGILPKHILSNEPNLMNSSFNTNPIGTGPYRLTQLEHSKNILLSAYDDYFEGRAKIDTISFSVVGDAMSRFLMLKSGTIDIDSLEPMQLERQLDKNFLDKFDIHESIAYTYSYLGFNLREKKFADPRVREALSLAIDRDELIDILFFDHAKVCNGPFLPATKAYNEDVKAPKQDIQKAKKLLQDAGYNEKNPLSFEIATSNSSTIRVYAAQILQHQLKKAGVDVKLKIMEWQAFLNMVVFPRKFETILLGWGLSKQPDPYMMWHSEADVAGGFNIIGYHNDKLDKMIEESQSIVDQEKIMPLFRDMFKLIADDNPYLFLYIPTSITAVSKKIKNIEPSPSGIWHNYIKWEIP